MTSKAPLRVLHLDTERGWRGGQNQVLQLLQGLRAKGLQQTLLCEEGEDLDRRTKGLCQHITWQGGSLVSQLRSFIRLRTWLKHNPPDIVHAHTSKAHGIALVALISLGKAATASRFIIHRRVDYLPSSNGFSRWKYLHARNDVYICVSEFVRKMLEDFGVPAQKLLTIRSAVPAPLKTFTKQESLSLRESYSKKLSLHGQSKIILCVAAFTEQKGHQYLIQALIQLKASHPKPFVVLFAGEGELLEDCKIFATKADLSDHVRFLGHRDDIDELIEVCDVGVLSSVDEGLGSILLNFAWHARPVCASSVGGIPEIIQNEFTGLLVPSRDPAALADCLKRMLENPEQARVWGENFYRWAQEHASMDANIEAIYRSYLASFALTREATL